MSKMRALKEEVAAYLQKQGGFRSAKVIAAFPAETRDFPLRRPMVAVGVERVELSPGALGGYWGSGEQLPLYGSGAAVTLRFDLYVPAAQGGDGLHALYEALCDHLMLEKNPFCAQSLTGGEISFDRAAGANRMSARAVLHAAVLSPDKRPAIEDIRLVRKHP